MLESGCASAKGHLRVINSKKIGSILLLSCCKKIYAADVVFGQLSRSLDEEKQDAGDAYNQNGAEHREQQFAPDI
uniref:Uncharacterized protein n=1 Tax=Ditylenchus dipsaci TaxID=166011 RepID=A0A915CWF4_9BILA